MWASTWLKLANGLQIWAGPALRPKISFHWMQTHGYGSGVILAMTSWAHLAARAKVSLWQGWQSAFDLVVLTWGHSDVTTDKKKKKQTTVSARFLFDIPLWCLWAVTPPWPTACNKAKIKNLRANQLSIEPARCPTVLKNWQLSYCSTSGAQYDFKSISLW